jgi:ABC-type multidrug transport system ATPase subunit
LGLSPRLVKDLFSVLRTITQGGQAVVLVEQNVHQSLRLADRVHVLENGRIVRTGSPSEIEEDKVIQQAYLGLESERPMAVQVETPITGGGFYNPAARPAAAQQAAAPAKGSGSREPRAGRGQHGQDRQSRRFLQSFRPVRLRKERAEPRARQSAAPRTEKPKDSGGFYNPGRSPGLRPLRPRRIFDR